jgi:hypothetical protein
MPLRRLFRVALLEGAFNMSGMTKGRLGQVPPSETSFRMPRRRAGAAAEDPNEAFLRAFADALRDILHAEIRATV